MGPFMAKFKKVKFVWTEIARKYEFAETKFPDQMQLIRSPKKYLSLKCTPPGTVTIEDTLVNPLATL